MLTPIEIQSKSFKSGIGYDRKDVDAFMREVLTNYERLYKENVEVKDKFTVLNERLQYYKSIEKTLQKALLLAEQTAEETKQAAMRNAKVIEKEARNKADIIMADAKRELDHVNQMITRLTQQYESYKVQYKQLAKAQIELIQSPTFELTLMNGDALNTSYTNPVDASKLSINADSNPETEDIFAIDEEMTPASANNIGNNDNPTHSVEVDSNLTNSSNQRVVKKASLGEEDLAYLKEHAEEFFQAEEFEQTNTNNNSNNDNMSDFSMVEEDKAPVESVETNTTKKTGTIESDFDFIDFEVNLD